MSKKKVINLAEMMNDNTMITPIQLLDMVRGEIEDGTINPNKLVILALDTEEDEWDWTRYACNISAPEIMTLATLITTRIAMQMNGDDDGEE